MQGRSQGLRYFPGTSGFLASSQSEKVTPVTEKASHKETQEQEVGIEVVLP